MKLLLQSLRGNILKITEYFPEVLMTENRSITSLLLSSEDLFDTVGPFMLNGCPDVKEGKVIILCNALFNTIHRPTSNTPSQVLFAPVNISNMSIADESCKSNPTPYNAKRSLFVK